MNHFNEKLIRLEDRDSIFEFLQQPTLELAEGLTAIMERPGRINLAVGHIVQAAIKGRLFQQIGKELDELKKAGRIKEDFFATHKQQATLHELLKFIDENPPDDEVFRALKSIFFSSVSTDANSAEEQPGYHLLQLCKQLRSGEILVLRATWNLFQESVEKSDVTQLNQWIDRIAKDAQIPGELLEVYEKETDGLTFNPTKGSNNNPIPPHWFSEGFLRSDNQIPIKKEANGSHRSSTHR